MEERFPKAWKYLRGHEQVLREREHSKYAKNNADGYGWYGATYPRGLDFYFRPKLMLQLLSRYNSVAYDIAGKFVFQAGGKGGGVYGVVPVETVNHRALQGLLSSKVTDFLIKQVSSVYGGRFYSYADQFLKDLPICQPLMENGSSEAKNAAGLAERISDLSEAKLRLLDKLAAFPESFASDLSKYELDTVKRICDKQPQSENLKISQDAIRVERALYGFEVHYGNQTPFEFEVREHAECLAEALRNQKKQNIQRKDVLKWRLPSTVAGCKSLLELVGNTHAELGEIRQQVVSQEAELNDLIFEVYALSKDERKVVDEFLLRYSSGPAAVSEEAEGPPDELTEGAGQ
jgi:hypothetical protein